MLGDADVLAGLLLGVLVIALRAVIGVAFGSLVSNEIAAIVVILAFTQFVEPVARLVLSQIDSVSVGLAVPPGRSGRLRDRGDHLRRRVEHPICCPGGRRSW